MPTTTTPPFRQDGFFLFIERVTVDKIELGRAGFSFPSSWAATMVK